MWSSDGHHCAMSAEPGFLDSGYRQNGERWTCPICRQVWMHFCDEAEGCYWEPQHRRQTSNSGEVTHEPRD